MYLQVAKNQLPPSQIDDGNSSDNKVTGAVGGIQRWMQAIIKVVASPLHCSRCPLFSCQTRMQHDMVLFDFNNAA